MQAAVYACTGIKVLGVQSCKRKRDACQTNSRRTRENVGAQAMTNARTSEGVETAQMQLRSVSYQELHCFTCVLWCFQLLVHVL